MSLKSHNQRLAELLIEEQGLADELLALSQDERLCCESIDSDRLIDIGVQRKEVLNSWEMTHAKVLTITAQSPNHDQSSQILMDEAIARLTQTIAAINENDQISLKFLKEKTTRQMARLRTMNQGGRLLQSLTFATPAFAHDSRE